VNDDMTVGEYTRNVGHEPRNLPDDHPDVWQWLYRGTPKQQERLREFLGIPDEEEVVVIEGQESLL
jgi:hypothetical protein